MVYKQNLRQRIATSATTIRQQLEPKPPNLAAEPNFYNNSRKTAEKITASRTKTVRKKRRFSRLNFRMIAVVVVGIFQNSDTLDTGNSFCDSWFYTHDSSILHNKKCDILDQEIVFAINLATAAIFMSKSHTFPA